MERLCFNPTSIYILYFRVELIHTNTGNSIRAQFSGEIGILFKEDSWIKFYCCIGFADLGTEMQIPFFTIHFGAAFGWSIGIVGRYTSHCSGNSDTQPFRWMYGQIETSACFGLWKIEVFQKTTTYTSRAA